MATEHTPLSADALTRWSEFAAAVEARLEAGRREYGDASFLRPPVEIAGEIEQELFDVVGWAFILWSRMRILRSRIEKGVER